MMIKGADELKSDLKIVLFSRKFHFVIIGEGQIFITHHQNCLLFEKVYVMIMGAVQMFK